MKHKSVLIPNTIEFINITPLEHNPLISKCQIKVCYVGDKPNRNKSIITKETAKKMASSLRGCPIVGFYNEDKGDFEEHNRIIDVSNGQLRFKDITRPYGFVDLHAKVWFQKFLDDNKDEREYMMTEGWIWTSQYPESKRIFTDGNNQSMELDDETLDGFWTKNGNGKPEFFIINEAIVSKLCTLGEENEPCFEGSQITEPIIQFAFEDGFKEQVFSMMNELKDLMNKGGEKVFTRYAVEISDTLWDALYSHVEGTYGIESVCEDGEQKFAVLTADDKYYRLNFSISEDNVVTFDELVSMLEDYTPNAEPQFDASAVEEYAKKKKPKDEEEDDDKKKAPADDEGEEKCPKCGKPKSKCTCEDEDDDDEDEKKKKKQDKKNKYNFEEIQEYVELSEKYSSLQTDYSNAQTRIAELEESLQSLTEFKNKIDRKEKEEMIAQFSVLSDEDKKDVIDNIDSYSVEDIEAKLSVICVRKKVSFNLDTEEHKDVTTYNLGGSNSDENTPAWILALRRTAANNI